ncbi:DinB family protein [Bacteroidota bacterium]
MKFNLILLIIFLFSSIIVTTQTHNDFSEDFSGLWKRAVKYTIELAEAMPEENYGFKPTEIQMTFGEQLIHISKNLYWLCSEYIIDEDNPTSNFDEEIHSKKEIIRFLKSSFNYVSDTIEKFDEIRLKDTVNFAELKINKERIFYLMRDHMTHHRGQLVVYLRLNKIEPPRYRGW